ncbi:MAG: hypothetical protein ACK4FJ_11765 [Ferrovibrio sp.]|uniref:hypothetical protein n=1 Tax=Ferrovibrio sp. TaxID=1917215 RepID=UPI00391D2B22
MPARTEREARLAQKLRANLARRKQQVRARESDSAENDSGQEADRKAGTATLPGLDRDDPPA